jgi:pimeloyl-ACP methyl ester carboxylesterase
LAGLGLGYASLTVGTRLGDTHVIALGPEGAPSVVFLPGGNALNPTCLKWFLPLAERHRLYAPDIVGQPGFSAQTRPSSKGDGHAFWAEDVLDGLGLERAPLVGLSYGAAIAIRTMGLAPERVCRAALVSPAGIAASPLLRMLLEIGPPTLLYRLRPTEERLKRVAMPLFTEPEDPAFGPAVQQLGTALRHLRLDADLPRTATEEELRASVDRWQCSPPRRTRSSPPGRYSRGRRRSSPTSPWSSPSKAAATSPRWRCSGA